MLTVRWNALRPIHSSPSSGIVGKAFGEPVGSVKHIALPGQKLLAVPVGPDAVQLFAHPPAGQIPFVVPGMGQEQARQGRLGGFCERPRCKLAAKAVLLGLFPAELRIMRSSGLSYRDSGQPSNRRCSCLCCPHNHSCSRNEIGEGSRLFLFCRSRGGSRSDNA